MKFWNVVAILALSCLLPIFAREPDNDAKMTGVKCQKAGGHCVDENSNQKCMVPLIEKPDCPKGEQCCKTGVKNAADLPLKKTSKKNCNQDPKCTDFAGQCIPKEQQCPNEVLSSLCSQSECTCCPGIVANPKPDLESLIRSMNKTLGNKLTEIYEAVQGGDEESCGMLNTEPISSNPLHYYAFAIPVPLLDGVDLCPPGSVLIPYEIPSFQAFDQNVKGITCTANSWVLEQHALGFTNCQMDLQYNTDFWYHDAPNWIEVHKPYYEAMRNCYAVSCNGLVCTDDFETCWLKLETPAEVNEETRDAINRNFWTTVCQ